MDAKNPKKCFRGVFGLSNKMACAALVAGVSLAATSSAPVGAQTVSPSANYEKDPATGDIYAKSVRTVQRTVMDTVLEPQQQVIYRPETVTETTPQVQTLYTPVTEVKWRPYYPFQLNFFRPRTVAYRPVAETYWERRSQVVNQTRTTLSYVPETRTVQVAKQVPKVQTQQVVSYQKVQSAAPSQLATRVEGIPQTVAARLKPMSNNEVLMATQRRPSNQNVATGTFVPRGSYPRTIARAMPPQTRVAAASVGRIDSDPPRRSIGQSGLRANNLMPSTRVIGQPLPASNIATFPTTIIR